jgi:hypothetical protein
VENITCNNCLANFQGPENNYSPLFAGLLFLKPCLLRGELDASCTLERRGRGNWFYTGLAQKLLVCVPWNSRVFPMVYLIILHFYTLVHLCVEEEKKKSMALFKVNLIFKP